MKSPLDQIGDWRWRFSHLYWIKPATGPAAILFQPRPAQWEILRLAYDEGNVRLAILKSRQLGFSTLLALICLDFLLFRRGVKIGIVDQTAEDAEKKRQKVKFAWDHLPEQLRAAYEIDGDSTGKFSIRLNEKGDPTRWLYAGKNVRGDTHDLLWISEWGPIQVEDSQRSDRIADGGLPSVEKGVCVVETTWRGGKSGRLWTDVVKGALELDEDHRTLKDWLVKFYPWYLDPELVWEGDTIQITNECRKYLAETEPLMITEAARLGFNFHGLTDAQRLWYFKVVWPKPRRSRFEEYPSLMAEMFLSPQPGAIYTEEMATLRAERRLSHIPIEPGHKVIVSFDLGRDDAMPCCFIQWIGHEVRIVDYHTANRETVGFYAGMVKEWCHRHQVKTVQIVLPHDSRLRTLAADKNIEEQFREMGEGCGLHWEVISVGAVANIWDGIDEVRQLLPYCHISTACDQDIRRGDKVFPSLVDCLDHYHALEMRDGRNITREPVHDRYSHGADSLRTFAEAHAKGLISRMGARRSPKVVTGHGNDWGGGRQPRQIKVKGRF